MVTSSLLEPGSLAYSALPRGLTAAGTCLEAGRPLFISFNAEADEDQLLDVQLLKNDKNCTALVCVHLQFLTLGPERPAAGVLVLGLSQGSASFRCPLSFAASQNVQHGRKSSTQISVQQRHNMPHTCREALMMLSALAGALTQELSSSHAHKLRSLQLHFAAHAPEEDNGSSSHDPNGKSKMNLGSTAGLLSTPHAQTEVEQAVDGSSDLTVKEGRIAVDPRPGRTNSLSRSSLITHLTSLLYDPSLHVRDEAAFALWHAKQRFMVRPLCSCYVPARQCRKHVKPRQSLKVWVALNRWIRWQSGSYLQLR